MNMELYVPVAAGIMALGLFATGLAGNTNWLKLAALAALLWPALLLIGLPVATVYATGAGLRRLLANRLPTPLRRALTAANRALAELLG